TQQAVVVPALLERSAYDSLYTRAILPLGHGASFEHMCAVSDVATYRWACCAARRRSASQAPYWRQLALLVWRCLPPHAWEWRPLEHPGLGSRNEQWTTIPLSIAARRADTLCSRRPADRHAQKSRRKPWKLARVVPFASTAYGLDAFRLSSAG